MSDELDIYSEEFLEERVDSDEITAGDEGFIRGYLKD